MDDSALTSQAIAELMRGMTGEDSKASFEPQERKINPLGKPNKRFLGRTINNALRHNKRESERTQASCQQKLQELDDRYERRKGNSFYSRNTREGSYDRRRRKSRSKKKSKKRHSSRDGTRSSRSSSRKSRSRSRGHKNKQKKTRKKPHKVKRRERRSRSTSSEGFETEGEAREPTTSRSEYYVHSNNLALAVAIAYSQTLCANQSQTKELQAPASPSSDIIRELMSDVETGKQDVQLDALSIASSSDEQHEIVTIDVSSEDEQSAGSTGTDSATESDAGSCIEQEDSYQNILASNSESDIEIIECELKQPKKELKPTPVNSTEQTESEVACRSANIATTVDLTDD